MASTRHHLRAQELLASLDAARQQRQENECSRNSVLDAEDVLAQLHEQLFIQKMHRDLQAAYTTSVEELARFETELNYGQTTRRHSDQRYMQDIGLEVPVAKLTTEDAVPNVRTINYGFKQLQAIRNHRGDGAKQLEGFVENAESTFTTIERLVETFKIEADPWYPVLTPVMAMLERLLDGREAGEPCQPVEDTIDQLNEKEEGLERKQMEAVAGGHLASAEGFMNQRITILEAITDLVTHKFGLLEDERASFVDALRAEVLRVESSVKSEAETIREQVDERKKRLSSDLAKLNRESAKATSDENLARTAFLKQKEASDDFLRANHTKQEELWTQLHDIERQLLQLARARRQEVDNRIKLLEREEHRRVDMSHFTDFVTQHTQLLQQTLRTCEAEDTIASKMMEVISAACNHVHDRVNFFESELGVLKNKFLMEHYSYFRRQYLLLGDAMYKKERYLDELEKKIDLETMQQHMRMEALDPAARVHANQREQLEALRQTVISDIKLFREKADLYVASFKPTERALALTGRSFVHPVQELMEINRKKGRSLAEYHALMVGQVDETKPTRTIASEAELKLEREQIENDRILIEQLRRKKSMSGNLKENVTEKVSTLLRQSSSKVLNQSGASASGRGSTASNSPLRRSSSPQSKPPKYYTGMDLD